MSLDMPYSLKLSGKNSDTYYATIAAFADRWVEEANATLRGPVESFKGFLVQEGIPDRAFEEVAFEMLVLGVLLGEHAGQALDMPPVPAWVLARLVEAQDRLPLPQVEKPVKAMRGLIQGLAQQDDYPDDLPADLQPFRGSTAELVERMIAWLSSAGWSAQAETLGQWQRYLAWLGEQRAQAILARCLLMAEAFEETSETVLGEYTRQAAPFAEGMQTCSRWRYDAPLVTRTRVEYHLGMLGTEILTRAYRERFLAMGRKIVIMPDCLCAHSRRAQSETAEDGSQPAECQAVRTALGGKCQGCTPGCKVNIITKLGEKRGFEAYILPDDMRGVGLGSCSKLTDVGVVGISCVLTNWDAGWQVNGAGVPCQGLLLDYAGCKSHWDEQGVPTDVNVRKLLEMVGESRTS